MDPTGADKGFAVGDGEAAPLFHGAARQAQAVRQQQAFTLRQRKFAEDHSAAPL